MLRIHSMLLVTFAWLAAPALAQTPGVRQAQPGAAPAAQPGAAAPGGAAQAPNAEAALRQQASYFLGTNVANNMRQQGIELDLQGFMMGMSDALSGAQQRFTDEQLTTAMQWFQQEMQQKAQARQGEMAAQYAANQQEEQQFLAANAQKEGVQVTPSGLQYIELENGSGPSPSATDVVRAHYRGTLVDGTVFDSSYDRGQPLELPVNQVIPGWTEALQMMQVGDKWKIFVPNRLAYGQQARGTDIQPGHMLIFDMELLGIVQQP